MNPGLLIGSAIGGFIAALITIFKKEWAPITVPIYAILEGDILGWYIVCICELLRWNCFSGYFLNACYFGGLC